MVSISEAEEKIRFQVELEFVQCLANPKYLNCKYRYISHQMGLQTFCFGGLFFFPRELHVWQLKM